MRARTAALPDGIGFWALAALLGLLMFAASAPSPLYGVYAAQWHFSATTLTAVFAVYAVALLAALLVAGRLSDHLGRRSVIIGALGVEAVAMICFITADSAVLLYVARILQGIATGGAIGALSAALVELSAHRSPALAPIVNSSAPTVGLAVGALATSALVQYGPAPTRLVYWLLLAAFAVGAVAVAAIREPGARRPGAVASLVPNVRLPRHARASFAGVAPCLVALWALGGFYLSLGPTLAAALTGSANLLWGGLVIFLLTGAGAVSAIACRAMAAQRAMLTGCLELLAGVGITLGGIAASSAPAFLVGSAVAGVGFGVAFLGAFRTLSALAGPAERAGMIAMIYIASYLAFSIPVVAAGIATADAGLRDTALAYGAAVALLAAAGAVASRPAAPAPARATARVPEAAMPEPATPPDLPPCPGTVPLCVHRLPASQAPVRTA